MAPVPLHLLGIVKYCRRCGNNDLKYMYNKNGRSDQPRYKCLNKECRALFTYGGKCRGPYGGKHPQVPVVQRHTKNRIGVVVTGHRNTRIAKPAVLRGAKIRLRVFPKSAPFEVKKILDEDLGGVIESAAIGAARSCLNNASSVGSNCLNSSASSTMSKLLHELPKSYEGIDRSVVKAAWSSTGAAIVDQRNASKKVHEGAESKVEWVKASSKIAPSGVVPVVEIKQLKRIRVKHQEREFIIENFT